MVIAFAIENDWKNYLDPIFDEGVRRGYGKPEMIRDLKKQASDFLEKGIPQSLWVNRHTMIAVTTMMLVAETYGLDTAPMEGFDPHAVRREFGLPENAQIITLLAIGFSREPDKPYGGRLALAEIVHEEHFGRRWQSQGKSVDLSSKEGPGEKERTATKTLQPA